MSKLRVREQLKCLGHIVQLHDYTWSQSWRFFKFCLVGGLGVLVDLSVLTLFVDLLGVVFPLARVLSFLVAMTSNFYLNRHWTFGLGAGHTPREYARYSGAAMTALCLNWIVSNLLYYHLDWFRVYYQIAAAVGVLASTVLNYYLIRTFVFNARICRDNNERS